MSLGFNESLFKWLENYIKSKKYLDSMSVVTLLGVDPVEGQLVAFPKTSLKFVSVGESVKLESGAVVIVSFSFLSESNEES